MLPIDFIVPLSLNHLTFDTMKDALSGLRQFSSTEGHLKILSILPFKAVFVLNILGFLS